MNTKYPTKFPAVSVIMNCLNCSKYLREAIDSVYAQTYKDWEIIFWDNTSTDSSAEIAKSYDERLRYFRSDETVPLGKARNWAIEKAKGEYIAFLDCDDIWLPEKLERQIPLFIDSQVGLVYSDAFHFLDGTKYAYSTYEVDFHIKKGYIFGNLLKNLGLTLSTIIIRKNILNNIPWFPEDMIYGEELDLILRIAHYWKIDVIPEPLARYRIHDANITVNAIESSYKERELILERLIQFIPNVMDGHKEEIEYFQDQNKLFRGHALWFKGNKQQARQIYLSLFKKRKKWNLLLCFLFSFFITYRHFHKLKVYLKYLKYTAHGALRPLRVLISIWFYNIKNIKKWLSI